MHENETGLIGQSHRTLDSVVCEEIRRQIITGLLEPGSRLVESSIAEELGVSRGPVRDAIRQLEREGFVAISPRRGASVAQISPSEALDCYEIRIALEATAARLAAKHRSDSDIEVLQGVLERGEEYLSLKRWDVLAQLNNEFHEALARASGNSQLPFLLNLYAKRITWMFARSAERRGPIAWVEHAAIVEAVAGRDPDLAERRAREHIEHSRQEFLVEFDEDALDS